MSILHQGGARALSAYLLGVVLAIATTTAALSADAVAFLKYGVGGYSTSFGLGPSAGYEFNGKQRQPLGAQLVAAGVKTVRYFAWTDNIAHAIDAVPAGTKVIVIGYSCGASQIPVDATLVHRTIELLAGIQASVYCGGYTMARNVLRAVEVYNPSCWMTGGLGCRRYEPGVGFAPTRLKIIERYDMHPSADLDPDAHTDILEEVAAALVRTPKAMLLKPPGDAPQTIVRTSSWRGSQ